MSHLLTVIAPDSAIDATVADYAHNLIVSTDLARLGRITRLQLRAVDLVKTYPYRVAPPPSELPERNADSLPRAEISLQSYVESVGTGSRAPTPPGSPFSDNLEVLAACLDLSALDTAILLFVAMVQLDQPLAELVDAFGGQSVPCAAAITSAAIGVPFRDVQAALAPDASLLRSGALTMNRRVCVFSDKLYLGWGLLDLLVTPGLNRDRLVARFLTLLGPSPLRLSHPDPSMVLQGNTRAEPGESAPWRCA